MTIARHKTAIGRTELSRPFQLALAAGVIREGDTILDYGCGRGGDLKILADLGFDCDGWDPVHRPDGKKQESDVVNLGYVVNVIEDADERVEALRSAWSYARKALIVAARVDVENRTEEAEELGDGVLTARGTFQKFFSQTELDGWLEDVLETKGVAAGPGIFFVFRSDSDRQRYASSLVRRHISLRVAPLDEAELEEHREVLEPLISFFEDRGRLPAPDELENAAEVVATFGSIPKSFQAVRRLLGEGAWQDVAEARRDDLLVHLALEKFRRRPRFSDLPLELQQDVKAFFSSYTAACKEADELLFSVGDLDLVNEACASAPVGKVTPEALYVHRSGLHQLPPLLRVYEGCARVLLGDVESNILKLDRQRPKISYLSYPDFDSVAHPPLATSIVVWLDTMTAKLYEFAGRENPPILHRKEAFVPEDYPNRERFARLTRQEERRELLDDPTIGTKEGWEALLQERGLRVAGHTLRRI